MKQEHELQIFAFDSHAVRVVEGKDKEPWFVATDVAKILGYRDAEKMTRILDDDEKGTHIVGTLGGDQTVSIISESGLYNAVLKSRLPTAKTFRKWVTSEVLPSIRKTGSYGKGANINQQLRAHGVRLRLLDAIERERHPEKRRAIQMQLDHASSLLGIPSPAYGSIGRERPGPPAILDMLWEALEWLEGQNIAFNHARDKRLLALNLPHLTRLATEHKLALPDLRELRDAMPSALDPDFKGYGAVNSMITGKTVKCFVFFLGEPDTRLRW